MKVIRRILGILVMIAGIIGLVISVAGLVAVWTLRPTIAGYLNNTITTLSATITTSQKVMEVTGQALGATVDSVESLSTMLSTTATSVEETQPVLDEVKLMMADTVPSALENARESLITASQAAEVLDSTIKSLENFRTVISATPFLGAFVDQPSQTYNPDVPLAESLSDLAEGLEDLPATFTDMATNLDKADNNLVTIQSNLTTMSSSVKRISSSLGEYETMVSRSQSSMDDLVAMLTNVQNNLPNILNGVAGVLSVFFFWLLAAQVVIFSQGWELYQGTAGRMEGGEEEPAASE